MTTIGEDTVLEYQGLKKRKTITGYAALARFAHLFLYWQEMKP